MRLSRATDQALRAALYLVAHGDRRVPVSEIAKAYDMPQSGLWKVARHLVAGGIFDAARGPGGGLRLARPPETIMLGEVVALVEGVSPLIDCTGCVIAGSCGLSEALSDACAQFHDTLNTVSLAEAARAAPATMPLLRAAPQSA